MLENLRILVVEDDEAINKVVCSYLGKRGAVCTAAFSGTEGLLRLEGGSFDLLISDLMLPGADGEDVVARATTVGLPVIVLSARATVADRVDLLQLGADDYLVKPFDLEELGARVEAVLRRAGRRAGFDGVTSSGDDTLRYGSWVLEARARTCVAGGVPLHQTPTEFAMEKALMATPARVHT
ncbi:MAG: response regulator transcription factor, partial [Adlercreutzia sp.]|nr:response regulator transcription factor [Adlercreutzia sp.]